MTMKVFSAALAAVMCPLAVFAAKYELLPNGGFEEVENGKPVHWVQFMQGRAGDIMLSTNDAQRGDWAVAVKTPAKFKPDTVALYTGTDGGGRGGYPVVAGGTYRMKAMIRSTKQAMIRFYLRLGDGGGGFLGGRFSPDIHTWDEWREYSHVFKIPEDSGTKKIAAGIFIYTPDDVVRVDNASLTFDTADNPGLEDIYAKEPPRTLDLGLTVASGTLAVDGKAGTVVSEGLHVLTVEADGAAPLRIASPRFPVLARRWRVKSGRQAEACALAFDDTSWALAEIAPDGTVKPPCAGAYTLRQTVMWNATKNSDWRLFVGDTERYSVPQGAVDTLQIALYSPFAYDFEDFVLNVELPDGFRFADMTERPLKDGYLRRCNPVSVTGANGRWRIGYGMVKASETRYSLLPLVAPTTSARGIALRYFRTARGNFTELPVEVPIEMLPPIKDNRGQPFVLEGYETGMLPPVSEEHAALHFAQTAKVGENRFFLNDESSGFARFYSKANPRGLFVHSPSGAFPLTLKLWGTIAPCEKEMIEFMKTNVASQVRYRGGKFKPLMREDVANGIHYAAWCPSWINGEGKALFQAKLTEIFASLVKENPQLKRGWIDWETIPFRGGQTGAWCWCARCLARFAKSLDLPTVPSEEEIAAKYEKQWNEFRYACDAESVRTIQEASKKAGVDFLVYSGDWVTPFYDLKGKVPEIFATVPGNSPALAYRQAFMERLRGKICETAGTRNFIAQRFALLGKRRTRDAWKSITVCSSGGTYQDDKLWKSQMVRMLVACQGGVDVQNLLYYPASAQYWMAEGIAAVRPYANLVKGSVPAAAERFSSEDIAYPHVVAVEKEGAVLACLYNERKTPKTVKFTLCGKARTVTIPPQDVVLVFSPSGPAMPSERRDWAGPHSAWYTKRAARRAGQTLDLVILGDSINHAWNLGDPGEKVWKEFFPDLVCENFAMAGDRTEHLLWRITEGRQLDGYKAKKILVMIGINNSHQVRPGASRADTPEEAAAGLKAVLDVVRKKQPQAEILLVGCLPAHWPGCDRLVWTREFNDIAKTFADARHIVYHELRDVLLKDSKRLDRSYFKDGIHLNEKGLRTYASFLTDLLKDSRFENGEK